jgi:hypothetical protein
MALAVLLETVEQSLITENKEHTAALFKLLVANVL